MTVTVKTDYLNGQQTMMTMTEENNESEAENEANMSEQESEQHHEQRLMPHSSPSEEDGPKIQVLSDNVE